jgi:tRNA U34 2-thiouridine synthase MnmA/TrmU
METSTETIKQRKAVALLSGGLDSMLAVKVIQEQGVHVEGINFFTGFCVEGHTHAIRSKDRDRPKRNNALWAAEQLGIKLHIIDISEDYKDVVINPKHGYGANLNPCLDCKSFMVREAQKWMKQHEFDFLITGEVMGQRPMSQRKDTMPVVSQESGAEDLLVRPLCAKLLPETTPEREGWIARDKLLNFSGRNRKPQIALAEEYGFSDYAQPAGGCCFLTDANYSSKLADLWTARGEKTYEIDDIVMLKVGRHLRPRPHFKLIIARDEGETNFLKGYRKQYLSMHTSSHSGPICLVDGNTDELSKDDLELAARIVARFSSGRSADSVGVRVLKKSGESNELAVKPLPADEVLQEWYV